MRYTVLTECNLKSKKDAESFKGFINDLDFDRLILAGGISNKESLYLEIMDTLPEDTTYLKGNSERRFDTELKESVEVYGKTIWHGHTIDPTYRLSVLNKNLGKQNRSLEQELLCTKP